MQYSSVLCLLLVLASGCFTSFRDEYILAHTSNILTFEQNDFELEIWIENEEDTHASPTILEDLLTVQKKYYEETGIEKLKHIMVWLPQSVDSWCDFYGERCYDVGALTNFITDLSDLYIVLPYWLQDTRYKTLKYYAHELTHIVAYELDGDTSRDHTDPTYWGDSGLMQKVLQNSL